MKTKKTPQQKKQLSYKKDRRNAYGENDKSSRTSIRFKKRYLNRSYRKSVRQRLNSSLSINSETAAFEIENEALAVKRKKWQKYPDITLKQHIARQQKNGGEG